MNVQMWYKALRIIPRLTNEEWKKLDVISRWLVSTRAAVLVMTFFSAAIAGLLTALDGGFVLWKWLLLTIGLIFAHATNNLLNDYTDFKRGVDKDNYFRTQYGPQPLQSGLMSERELLTYAAITGLIALAAGLPLVILNGWTAWALLAAGVIFVLFYTWPLKYIGMGEISVILIWGPLMVAGGYFVITGQWNWNVAIASLPYALGPTTVLFGKHIDKLDQDQAKGIHTLPVILGEKTARYAVLVMMALMYLLVGYLILIGYFSPVMAIILVGLTSLPGVWVMYKAPKPKEEPASLPKGIWPLYFSAASFAHNRRYGTFFLLGLILELVLKAILN
jgi:1,4-dihydroxy-2-naphthoate polyprenyltransferase